ncbi:MAG: ATP-binding protein [Bacteroidota bacterium]|nr:ATP-binding protein [Bacteroidota bacterium]
MKFNLQLKIAIGSVLMIITLAILSYQYYRTLEQLIVSHLRSESSLRISKNLEAMHLLLKDSETAHRDYLITGKENYLNPYYHTIFQLENLIKNFEKTIHADSVEIAQANMFDKVKPLLNQRINEQRRAIMLKRKNEVNILLDSIDSDLKREELNQISDIIKKMELDEERHLQQLTVEEAEFSKYLIKLVPILTIIFSLLIIGGAIVLILDVSERQKLQLDLALTNHKLRASIDALDASNKELVSINNSLESFSSTVSHDLRSPANQQAALIELLLLKEGPKISEEGKVYLQKIKISASRMKQLISDLLQFSRLGKKEITTTEVDLNEIVKEIVDHHKAQNSKLYKVTVSPLPIVKADKGLINQVWENLISNAFKYSSKVPTPEIIINYESQKNEFVFGIKDNGDGFDMSKATNLFKVFNRMHRSDEFEGTGVGLSIVQKIVEKHGGKIWAQSEPKKGARFYFTLPKG